MEDEVSMVLDEGEERPAEEAEEEEADDAGGEVGVRGWVSRLLMITRGAASRLLGGKS